MGIDFDKMFELVARRLWLARYRPGSERESGQPKEVEKGSRNEKTVKETKVWKKEVELGS